MTASVLTNKNNKTKTKGNKQNGQNTSFFKLRRMLVLIGENKTTVYIFETHSFYWATNKQLGTKSMEQRKN